MIEGGHGQSVVLPCHALAKDHINGKANRPGHGDRISLNGSRMRGNTILRGHHDNSYESDQHAHHFMSGGALQAEQHSQNKDVDRAQPDNHRSMAHMREIQPDREAHLIHGYTEKAKIEEYPQVATCELLSP